MRVTSRTGARLKADISKNLRVSLVAICCSFVGALSTVAGVAQTLESFQAPRSTGVLGTRDPGAVAEISDFLSASKAADYIDLTASGTVAFAWGGGHPVSGNAVLYAISGDDIRLDTTADSMRRSLRICSTHGAFSLNNGKPIAMQSIDAAVGLLGYTRLLSVSLSDRTVSLVDRGMVSIEGVSLHRITLETPLVRGSVQRGLSATVSTDFYFDTHRHLPLYSVDNILGTSSPTNKHIRAISYADWQQFQGVTLPTTVTQTFDGQPIWAMQFNQFALNTGLTSTTFIF